MQRQLMRMIFCFLVALLLCVVRPELIQRPVAAAIVAQTAAAGELEQQARSRYQASQFAEAASLFQQAAIASQTQGDRLRQAINLSNLSLCYQQLAAWEQAHQAIQSALALLPNQSNPTPVQQLALAQIQDIYADFLLTRGRISEALSIWERVTQIYQQQGRAPQVLASQANQAKALQHLGLHRRAIVLLQAPLNLTAIDSRFWQTPLAALPATPETAIALHRLGESLRVTGDLAQAKQVMERCLAIAQQLQLLDVVALAQLSLGNIAYSQSDDSTAAALYQQVTHQTTGNLRLEAQLNQLKLLIQTNQVIAIKQLIPQIQQQFATLPANRESIEARINFAQSLMQWGKDSDLKEPAQVLALAHQQARELGDPRLQSSALGSLGSVYERAAWATEGTERSRQWATAAQLTRSALQLIQPLSAGELAYLWQWQLGRILTATGQIEAAISAYREAVATIQSLRADLAIANPNLQFSFRNAVEPIHRQLVKLLLQSTQRDRLKTARDIIESLQLVELDNFFREACLQTHPAQIDQVDQRAAVIYPILLDDQLAIITSFPQPATATERELRYYKTAVPRSDIEEILETLRDDLDQETTSELALPKLQRVYDWLVRPIAADLAKSPVETLVFVLDGSLRNIPMAALHDGNQFLIEQYSIALTPGLQLISPRSLKQEPLSVLAAGLNAERDDFPPLPYVERELQTIQSELPHQVLFNQAFTKQSFQQRLTSASFPIVHLATHGKFGGTAGETFILTWDGKLTIDQLSNTLQSSELSRTQPLELLVLSACETATGDDRAALGLAGVAVRSGARSTVASLWAINDQATATLMGKFYSELAQLNQTGISKAEALRRAQLSILNDPQYQKQPYFWAAFVLIGNWT